MSSWSTGLIKIINRASTIPFCLVCETCQLLQFCQAGWDLGIFHKPQLRNCVGVSNFILRKKITPDPYRYILEGDSGELEDSEYSKYFPLSSLWAVAERIKRAFLS